MNLSAQLLSPNRVMNRRNQQRVLLIIGDNLVFGPVIRTIVQSGSKDIMVVRYTTYESFRGVLTPRVIRETQLFILELWRNYPTGLRAEAVAVAEELFRQRAKPLIVSPLSFANKVNAPWYWDLSSEDGLAERCMTLLSEKQQRGEFREGFVTLNRLLGGYVAKHPGHEIA